MKCYLKHRKKGDFNFEAVWLCVCLAALAVARFLPVDQIPFRICGFHRLTGKPCLTCGATRCFVDLAHGRWAEGFATNPLAGVLFFLTLAFVLYAAIVVLLRLPRLRARFSGLLEKRLVIGAFIAIALVNWVYLIWAGV